MKKILLISLVVAFGMSLAAQKPFAGTVTYTTTFTGTTDANILAQNGTELVYKVLDNKMKMEQKSEVGVEMIMNGDNGTIVTVIDLTALGFGKYISKDTVNKDGLSKYDYAVDKNNTKTILNYNCYKVVCTTTDLETDETEEAILYVTEDFIPNAKNAQYPGLSGFVMYAEQYIGTQDVTVIQEVSAIAPNKKIKAVDFFSPSDAIPFSEMPDEVKKGLGIKD